MSVGAAEIVPGSGEEVALLDVGGGIAARSPLQLYWRRFRHDRLALAALTVIGVIIGVLAGFYGGWTDMLLSRVIDVVLSIPFLLLGLGIGAACSVRGCLGGAIQPGLGVVIFLIAFVNWTYIGRIVRGLVLSMREREFVEASRALGASRARIMFREILPNLVAPIIVYSSLLI